MRAVGEGLGEQPAAANTGGGRLEIDGISLVPFVCHHYKSVVFEIGLELDSDVDCSKESSQEIELPKWLICGENQFGSHYGGV